MCGVSGSGKLLTDSIGDRELGQSLSHSEDANRAGAVVVDARSGID